jgi:hypothetical protein
MGMHAEQRRTGTPRLDRHQWRPTGRYRLGAENPCQLVDSGGFEKCSQGQLDAEDSFNLSKELNGQGGVPSQIEVILVGADRLDAEEFSPNAGELSFCVIFVDSDLGRH